MKRDHKKSGLPGVPSVAMVLGLLWSACANLVPSVECEQFISCVRERDEFKGTTTNLIRFEADGGCWNSPTGAELCTNACIRGTRLLYQTESGLPASCKP